MKRPVIRTLDDDDYYRAQIDMAQCAVAFLDVAPDSTMEAERKLGLVLYHLLKLADHFALDVARLVTENISEEGA